MTTGNPVEEGILKLIEKGYEVNDVYNIMTQIGWQPDEVQLSMNEMYERRAKENEAIAKQRQDAIDQVNASYEELKKKATPVQSDAFLGTFPGEPSSALDALDDVDSQVLKTASRSSTLEVLEKQASSLMGGIQELNKLKEIQANETASPEERSSAAKRIPRLEQQIQGGYDGMKDNFVQANGMGLELDWGMNLDFDQDKINTDQVRDFILQTHMKDRSEAESLAGLGRVAKNTYKEFMGVDFPEIESIGDLQNEMLAMSMKRALDNARAEEEEYGDSFVDYDMEEYKRAVEDQTWLSSTARGGREMLQGIASGVGLQILDLGDYLRENKGIWRGAAPFFPGLSVAAGSSLFSQALDSATGIDSRDELIHYRDRQREQDRIRKNARDKELFDDPSYWGLGISEREKKIKEDLESGKIDGLKAAELLTKSIGNTMEEVVPSAIYYGGLSMAGPPGWGAIAVSASGQKYGDLVSERPDLSFEERMLISATVGTVEGITGAIFRGAEKAIVGPLAKLYAPAAIKAMGKEGAKKALDVFGKSGALRSVLGEGAEEAIAYVAELGIENAVDSRAGRKTREFSRYELSDAVQGGMLGGAGMTGAGSLVRSAANRGHHQTRNRKLYLQKAISETRRAISGMPNGVERQELRKQLYNLNKEYRDISEMETLTYGKYSVQDRAKIMSLNREIAFVEDMIKYKKDSAGIGLNKDQLKALEARLKGAMEAKVSIESRYESVEKTAAKHSKSETETAEDVESNEAQVESSVVDKAETKEQQKEVPLAENSDPAKKEGEQLALFDEQTFPQETTTKDAPVAEETAPAEESTEAPEVEPVSEKTDQRTPYGADNEVDTNKGFDLADRNRVGDGEGQISIDAASAFNRALKGFKKLINKAGTKIYAISRADFDAIAESRNPQRFVEIKSKGQKIGGYYDTQNNAIILPTDARVSSIQEEFGHAFMLPVINGQANPKLQQELYKLLVEGIESKLKGRALKKFQSWKENRSSKYEDQTTPRYREEMILGFFKYYKTNTSDFKGASKYIRDAVNKILKKAGFQGTLPISNDNKLLSLADTYAQMSEGIEADLDVTSEQFQEAQERAKTRISKEEAQKRDDESDEQYAARMEDLVTKATGISTAEDMSREEAQENQEQEQDPPGIDDLYSIEGRKKFTYLKDTEVFYTDDPYVDKFGEGKYERGKLKRARFNDYFHFRNWYNKITSNQTRPRISNMYFIKDGKKYEVKPPKIRVDRNGKPVTIEGPENQRITNVRRSDERSSEKARSLKEAQKEVFDFGREADEALKRAGLDAAQGMAFMPNFDYEAYSQIEDKNDQFSFVSRFRRENVFQKSPSEMFDIVEVARKNLEALKESGLSPDELQASNKSEVFNLTGIKNISDTVDGDSLDEGDMFAVEDDDASFDHMPLVDRNAALINYRNKIGVPLDQTIRLSSLNGSKSLVVGFDPSYIEGIAGVRDQVGKTFNGDVVLSSHRDFGIAERFMKKMIRLAKSDAKKGKDAEGYITILTGSLTTESLLGNPQVYAKTWEAALSGLSPKARIEKANTIIKSQSKARLRAMLSQPGVDKNTSLSDKITDFRLQGVDITLESEGDLMEFIKATSLVDPSATKLTFEARTAFSKSILVDGGVVPTKKLAVTWAEENFLDEALEQFGVKSGGPGLGTIYAATKIPYRIEKGVVKGFTLRESGGAFSGVIVAQEVDGMEKSMGTQWARTPIGVSKVVPGARKRVYKDKKPVQTPTGRDKTKRAFPSSLNQSELSREEKDGLAKSRLEGEVKVDPQDDFLSIENDFTSVETDQGTFEMPTLTGYQMWRNLWVRRLVDKYNDIFDVQKAIENQKGRVSKDMDFKMKEELMYGKAAQALSVLDDKVQAIKKVMKEGGVSLDEINNYIYALHAKERNQVIKERIEAENEDRAKKKKKLVPVTEKGSGMSNERADEIINSAKPSQKKALDKLEGMIREIQDDTRSTMVEFGLESQQTIDAWGEMFSRYVPLAGLATDEQSEATSSYPTGGAGISVFGSTTKRAKGRKNEAENILAQVIAQNAATHIKSRTNEAVRSLYDLAKNNPNKDVWEVLDEANSLEPNVVSVRVDGEQKFIRFKNAGHAQSLKNMNLPETNLFLKALRAPSNWLRKSFTTLNPEFVITNFARDIQTAVFNAAAEAEIEGGMLNGEKVMGDIMKTTPKALKSLLRGQMGFEQDAEMKRYYEEFKEDGAKTGWAYAKNLSEIAADLESSTGDKTKLQNILGVGKNAVDFVEGMNEAFEDSVRLASYVAARRNGVSREKAAQLAKNITVNFNKHGEWGQALNGVYLFFNASVQGTSRMFRSLANAKPVTRPDGTTREWYERANTAQKMAAGLSLFSSMLAMINAGLSDEDEDDVLFYDKIPDYVKERNLIIMNPRDGKTYYKIPLPYGFNIFSNMGTVAADVARGGMTGGRGMHFLAEGLVNAFSPISFGQSESLGRAIAKGGIPTVAKPFFDAWGFNETYFGGPVASEQLPFGTKKPESSMSFRSPDSVKDFFTFLNEATGGSDRVSGGVDINPDRMWYVLSYFVGGAGNFVGRTGKTIKAVGGKFKDSDYDIAVNDIPFIRVMYGEQSKYYDQGKFRENETEVKQLFLERKDTRDWNNPRYDGILRLNNKLKVVNKRLKSLRDQRRKARNIKDWTRRSIEVQRIMDEERRLVMEFNKLHDEIR